MQGSATLTTFARVAIVPVAAVAGLWTAATTVQAAGGVTVCARGCTYTTIASAVAAAASGDVITVKAGTYTGGFVISTPVTIRGAGPWATVIRGGDSNAGTVVEIRANPVTISGVTITGGSWSSGSGLVGGGVITDGGAVLNLADCSVSGNQGGTAGGGGGINSYGTTNIAACGVSNNSAGTAADPGQGGGIHVGATGVVNLNSSLLWGNSAGWGGGMDIDSGGAVRVSFALVAGNTAVHQGAGIDNNGSLLVSRSWLVANKATQGGGMMDNGTVTLDSSVVELNVATGGLGSAGGVFVTSGSTLTLNATTVANNKPDNLVRA